MSHTLFLFNHIDDSHYSFSHVSPPSPWSGLRQPPNVWLTPTFLGCLVCANTSVYPHPETDVVDLDISNLDRHGQALCSPDSELV